MKKHNKEALEALAELLWWNAFKKQHAKEMHLFKGDTRPQFSEIKKQRRDHYIRKASEFFDIIESAGCRVVKR